MLGADLPREPRHLLLERECCIRRHGDREPDVELARPLVVVADAWVAIELRGCAVEVIGRDLQRHQHRVVTEFSRIEDGGDLANDRRVASVQPLDSRHHLMLIDADARAKVGEWPPDEGEVALHLVEDAGVDVVACNPKSRLGFANGRFGRHAGQSNVRARRRIRGLTAKMTAVLEVLVYVFVTPVH